MDNQEPNTDEHARKHNRRIFLQYSMIASGACAVTLTSDALSQTEDNTLRMLENDPLMPYTYSGTP